MKKPKISVLMAAHNQEQFIKKSIKSILNQSFKDFEFLILDDASKDKTLNIIKKFQKEDKRIRLFRNEKNLGLTKSLIKLTRLARGEFIARMDSDDISLKSRFNDQISWFENDKKKVLILRDIVSVLPTLPVGRTRGQRKIVLFTLTVNKI